MPARFSCPVCGSDMRSLGMSAHYSLKPYRVCPDCQAKLTADGQTRRRRLLIGVFGILTLALVGLSLRYGVPWGFAAGTSGAALLAYTGYTLSKMKYVKVGD